MYYDERNNYFDYVSEENNSLYDIKSNKYFTKNLYKDPSYEVGNINIYNYRLNNHLVTPSEGLNRGNMFSDEYFPYKNYYYKVVVKGKREELLLKIQELTFAVKDLNIYLDVYPNDLECLELFKVYAKELEGLKSIYEKEYGSLIAKDVTSTKEFTWINNPWPWDKGGTFNV